MNLKEFKKISTKYDQLETTQKTTYFNPKTKEEIIIINKLI